MIINVQIKSKEHYVRCFWHDIFTLCYKIGLTTYTAFYNHTRIDCNIFLRQQQSKCSIYIQYSCLVFMSITKDTLSTKGMPYSGES